jgi:5,10-methylenetetrahydrofolate reductase
MALADLLAAESFVVTGELGPPASADGDAIVTAATALAGVLDAANITDNQAATVKMSPLAAATFVQAAGVEPILQMTARDRNLLALQADLLGAHALGVRTVLALGGDPLKVGRYEGTATHVRDLDSLGLIELIAAMNAGTLRMGEELPAPTGFLIVGAANPLVDSLQRVQQKLDAGVGMFQTNIVYDVDRFAQWFEPFVQAGVAERAPVLVGVTPPRSERMLRHLHDNIPGVEVDDATFARMGGLQGEDAKAEGIAIARDVIAALREVPGVAGVHLMAPGWEAEALPLVAEAASLTRAR